MGRRTIKRRQPFFVTVDEQAREERCLQRQKERRRGGGEKERKQSGSESESERSEKRVASRRSPIDSAVGKFENQIRRKWQAPLPKQQPLPSHGGGGRGRWPSKTSN